MQDTAEWKLELLDTQWPFEYTDHERLIARAIVYDDEGYFYFNRVERADEFGTCALIETAGGGVEQGEALPAAVKRELREELGVEVELTAKLGLVCDYYNLIHRRNLNHYYLCRLVSQGEKHLTQEEISLYRLTTLRMTLEEAMAEYEHCSKTPLGALIAARELPILKRAGEILGMYAGKERKMNYLRPTMADKALLEAYVAEHHASGENSISASLGLPVMEYTAWVESVRHNETAGNEFGKSLLFLCREENRLIGLLSVRYDLPPELAEKYGHIGYGVRPCERGKGYATAMLAYGLQLCREKGLERVILGCYKDNAASAAVIRKNGGVLYAENENYKPGRVSQYFIITL